MRQRLVVIGNGMAGMRAVDWVEQREPQLLMPANAGFHCIQPSLRPYTPVIEN